MHFGFARQREPRRVWHECVWKKMATAGHFKVKLKETSTKASVLSAVTSYQNAGELDEQFDGVCL